ncbi:MAG: hypothetical protein R3F11_00930 [Verrucomicrobiales bacterium]
MRPPSALALALAAFAALLCLTGSSCQSLRSKGGSEAGKLPNLTLSPPPDTMHKWVAIPASGGQHYVTAVEQMDDWVMLSAVVERQPAPLANNQDVVASLSSDGIYKNLRQDAIFSHAIVRFDMSRLDQSGGSEPVRQALNLPQRRTDVYYRRTRGIAFIHPKDPNFRVMLACTRTSPHGLIGSHFDGIALAWFEQFFLENSGRDYDGLLGDEG